MANKKRLIDAYALWAEAMGYADTGIEFDGEGVANFIANAPTVDAVEVVLYKDCKHLGFKGLCDGVCNRKMVGIVKPDDFCSYG